MKIVGGVKYQVLKEKNGKKKEKDDLEDGEHSLGWMKISIMRNDKQNVIVEKSIELSLSVIKFCELLETDKKYVIARQLLRSATSIGANVCEAQNAESKVDFTHKMKVAAKEASETQYWLLLCERAESYRFDPQLKLQGLEIIRIISKIISSSKGNRGNS